MNLLTDSLFIHFPLLVIPVSLVYGATRHEDPFQIILEAVRWLYRLIVFLGTISFFIIFLSWIA